MQRSMFQIRRPELEKRNQVETELYTFSDYTHTEFCISSQSQLYST